MGNKKFKKLYEYVDEVCAKLGDETERQMFRQCYLNTLETTVEDVDGDVFIKTGDIPAMWLRDSSVQVSHYVRLAGADEDVRKLIVSTLKRQFECILIDPYANAFNKTANGKGHKDITKLNDRVWERKYELDSLVYPLWLLNNYYRYTKDAGIFDKLFFDTYGEILNVMRIEQRHDEKSDYSFKRVGEFAYDTLPNDGKGEPSGYTGMVWSAFRPSDDRCAYHYLVPSNMFAVAVLRQLLKNLDDGGIDNPLKAETESIIAEIDDGVKKFGLTECGGEKIYAYETDGKGNYNFMDDANVPSLLSMPYLGYCEKDDKLYLSTRKAVLSAKNPYYYSGKLVSGVGSPHTPEKYVWHIAVIMQALTSTDENDVEVARKVLKNTTAGTLYMHEGFHVDDDTQFTRSWFAWANTLYAIFVIDKILK